MADLTLTAGSWEARLRPEVGGCLSALTLRGNPVLRSMPDAADHPLQSACFPLVPYCNRFAHGRFTFAGRDVTLPPNLPPHPHPLHGLGWLRPWRVVRHDTNSALLEGDYAGDAEWPWAYRAHQHIALDESGCTVRLMVENRASEPAPIGLGFHPYFRRLPDARVQFAAEAMLGIDAEFLADGTAHPADTLARWDKGSTLPAELVDHCFTGWGGTATITDAQGTIALRGFGTPYCHVFAPRRGEELCLEPVNHAPDALNREPDGMIALPPGAAAGVAMRIEAEIA